MAQGRHDRRGHRRGPGRLDYGNYCSLHSHRYPVARYHPAPGTGLVHYHRIGLHPGKRRENRRKCPRLAC